MFQQLGIMSLLIGRCRTAVYDPEKEAFFLWQNTSFLFHVAERRMRDGSLAKNKPLSECRGVNHVMLLIRNCWIVLKSDLKRSTALNSWIHSQNFQQFLLALLNSFLFLSEKKKKTSAVSVTPQMDTFFAQVTLCAATMNNQLDSGVHDIHPEATIKLLILLLWSLFFLLLYWHLLSKGACMDRGWGGWGCDRGGCERCFFELYGSIWSHHLFIMLVPGIIPS